MYLYSKVLPGVLISGQRVVGAHVQGELTRRKGTMMQIEAMGFFVLIIRIEYSANTVYGAITVLSIGLLEKAIGNW